MKSLSIRTKFILAFLTASLLGIALVAVFLGVVANQQFQNIILENLIQGLSAKIIDYFEVNQTLMGVERVLRPPGDLTLNPSEAFMRPGIVLALPDWTVFVGDDMHPKGSQLTAGEFSQYYPIEVKSGIIAYLVPFKPLFRPNPQEARFIERTNRALLYASFIAAGLAVLLGFGFTNALLKPLHSLHQAIHKLERGDLKQQIPITTDDEFGEVIEAFNQMSTALANANAQREQMTADIAHELRSPLTVISGYLEAIEDGSFKPTPTRLDAIKEEVQLLNRLVTDLRTLALADARQLSIQKEHLNLVEFLSHLEKVFHFKTLENQITLDIKPSGSINTIYADRMRLIQILTNLINNAIRHTPPGGRIQVTAKATQKEAEFQVIDSGEGIPEKNLALIFQRFFRADQARQTDSGEVGLGLSIVKALVESHHGSISVSSKLGVGTTFTIVLPQT